MCDQGFKKFVQSKFLKLCTFKVSESRYGMFKDSECFLVEISESFIKETSIVCTIMVSDCLSSIWVSPNGIIQEKVCFVAEHFVDINLKEVIWNEIMSEIEMETFWVIHKM